MDNKQVNLADSCWGGSVLWLKMNCLISKYLMDQDSRRLLVIFAACTLSSIEAIRAFIHTPQSQLEQIAFISLTVVCLAGLFLAQRAWIATSKTIWICFLLQLIFLEAFIQQMQFSIRLCIYLLFQNISAQDFQTTSKIKTATALFIGIYAQVRFIIGINKSNGEVFIASFQFCLLQVANTLFAKQFQHYSLEGNNNNNDQKEAIQPQNQSRLSFLSCSVMQSLGQREGGGDVVVSAFDFIDEEQQQRQQSPILQKVPPELLSTQNQPNRNLGEQRKSNARNKENQLGLLYQKAPLNQRKPKKGDQFKCKLGEHFLGKSFNYISTGLLIVGGQQECIYANKQLHKIFQNSIVQKGNSKQQSLFSRVLNLSLNSKPDRKNDLISYSQSSVKKKLNETLKQTSFESSSSVQNPTQSREFQVNRRIESSKQISSPPWEGLSKKRKRNQYLSQQKHRVSSIEPSLNSNSRTLIDDIHELERVTQCLIPSNIDSLFRTRNLLTVLDVIEFLLNNSTDSSKCPRYKTVNAIQEDSEISEESDDQVLHHQQIKTKQSSESDLDSAALRQKNRKQSLNEDHVVETSYQEDKKRKSVRMGQQTPTVSSQTTATASEGVAAFEYSVENNYLIMIIKFQQYQVVLDSKEIKEMQIKFSCIQQETSCGREKFVVVEVSDVSKTRQIARMENLKGYKNKMLSSVSHELRTPLNCSIQMLEILTSSEDIGELDKQMYINPALSSNYLLLNIINDILDMAQISYGEFRLTFSQLDLRKLCAETINLVSLQAFQKNITLEFDFDSSIPARINSDANRIRQVLLNLLSNALKFTQKGKIAIRGTLVDEDLIQLDVEDTGCGIAEYNLQKIFGNFGRAAHFHHGGLSGNANEVLDTVGGGFGLTIANNLAAGLGGNRKLNVKSKEGIGSIFSFCVVNNLPGQIGSSFKQKQVFSKSIINWENFSQYSNNKSASTPYQQGSVHMAPPNHIEQSIVNNLQSSKKKAGDSVSQHTHLSNKPVSLARFNTEMMFCVPQTNSGLQVLSQSLLSPDMFSQIEQSIVHSAEKQQMQQQQQQQQLLMSPTPTIHEQHQSTIGGGGTKVSKRLHYTICADQSPILDQSLLSRHAHLIPISSLGNRQLAGLLPPPTAAQQQQQQSQQYQRHSSFYLFNDHANQDVQHLQNAQIIREQKLKRKGSSGGEENPDRFDRVFSDRLESSRRINQPIHHDDQMIPGTIGVGSTSKVDSKIKQLTTESDMFLLQKPTAKSTSYNKNFSKNSNRIEMKYSADTENLHSHSGEMLSPSFEKHESTTKSRFEDCNIFEIEELSKKNKPNNMIIKTFKPPFTAAYASSTNLKTQSDQQQQSSIVWTFSEATSANIISNVLLESLPFHHVHSAGSLDKSPGEQNRQPNQQKTTMTSFGHQLSLIREKSNELVESIIIPETKNSAEFLKHNAVDQPKEDEDNYHNVEEEEEKMEPFVIKERKMNIFKEKLKHAMPQEQQVRLDELKQLSQNIKSDLINFNKDLVGQTCLQILLVDDNDFNLYALEVRLKQYGFQVEKATSGDIAIDLIKKKFNSAPVCFQNCKYCKFYPLILMDIDMPIKNGYQTTTEILDFFKQSRANQKSFISACSAFVQESEKSKAIEVGMQFYLTKPINAARIEYLLSLVFLKPHSTSSFYH